MELVHFLCRLILVLSLGLESRCSTVAPVEGTDHGHIRTLSKRSLSGPITVPMFHVKPWVLGGVNCVNLSLGTPPQTMTFVLDFSWSGTLVHAVNSTNNAPDSSFECRGGMFDASSSLTFKTLTSCQKAPNNRSDLEPCDFEGINITDGSLSVFQTSDHLQFGDALFANFPFELIMSDNEYTSDTFALNVLGLGYSVHPITPFSNRYPNLLESLVTSGIIEARVFGVGFGADMQNDIGELVLGGFDGGRFATTPVTMNFSPMHNHDDANDEARDMVSWPIIPITNVTIQSESFNQTFTYPSQGRPYLGALDYHSPWWEVPPEIFDAILHALNSTGAFSAGRYLPCEGNGIIYPDVYIEFAGNFTHLSAGNLLIPWIDIYGKRHVDEQGREICNLTIQPTVGPNDSLLSIGTSVIGDLYTILDFDNG